MSQPTKINMNFILVGDELGQIKLAQLDSCYDRKFGHDIDGNFRSADALERDDEDDETAWSNFIVRESPLTSNRSPTRSIGPSHSLDRRPHRAHRHKVIRILDQCLRSEPTPSRAITNIRPIENSYESNLDSTDRPNNLFLVSNRVGQMFVCDTDAMRNRLRLYHQMEDRMSENFDVEYGYNDCHQLENPMISPIYYNVSNRSPVCGGQPINRTNILVIYQNGDIQHVRIGQEVLQSSLKIKRKAIRMLGLGYNSDARAVHWRIDGSTGICYVDSDLYMDKEDPLTKIILRSPTHRLVKRPNDILRLDLYNEPPCTFSRKFNAQERLIPGDVVDRIVSREDYTGTKPFRCQSVASLNLNKTLALRKITCPDSFDRYHSQAQYYVTSYQSNGDRLAVGGYKYGARVYDIQTQKAMFNCRFGPKKNPLPCTSKGEPTTIGDVSWLGGNKATKKMPDMLATCSGADSIVNVFDLRCPKPVFHIDLTGETEEKWQPYENHHPGAVFTSLCSSSAPFSTAVPSQQLVLGSTSGQMIVLDLRFVSKSCRTMGKLSGVSGGSVREMRFVTESFDTSKVVSCSADRFIRVHKIQTSYTSVISQKLATLVFIGSKPTCVQPVCDELTQTYLTTVPSRCGSEYNMTTTSSEGWSLLGIMPQ